MGTPNDTNMVPKRVCFFAFLFFHMLFTCLYLFLFISFFVILCFLLLYMFFFYICFLYVFCVIFYTFITCYCMFLSVFTYFLFDFICALLFFMFFLKKMFLYVFYMLTGSAVTAMDVVILVSLEMGEGPEGGSTAVGIIGRPASTDVWCPDDLGRESWDLGGAGVGSRARSHPLPQRGKKPSPRAAPSRVGIAVALRYDYCCRCCCVVVDA